MNKLFLQVINLNMMASFMIIFILFIRLLFKRFPKRYSYILWILLLIRLIIPISIETKFNPIDIDRITNQNTDEYVIHTEMVDKNKDIKIQENTEINKNQDIDIARDNKEISSNDFNNKRLNIRLEYLWLVGVLILLSRGILSSHRLRRHIRDLKPLYDNIYESDEIKTGFVFGIFKPKILVPSFVGEKEKIYIITHEAVHLKRYDHVIKILYYIILSIYWFNPLMWFAFPLMSKDMELSCDEAVLRDLEYNKKTEYAEVLLSISIGEQGISSLTAFGQKDIKNRIKNILEYKNISKKGSIILIVTLIIFGFIMFTRSKDEEVLNEGNLYGIENREFKDPREAAELIFNWEYEDVLKYSDAEIKILEKGITNFEKLYSYTGYLQGDLEVFRFGYKIKAEDPDMFNVMEYQEDNSITEDKMSLGRPLLVFENNGKTYKFIGVLYSINVGNESKAGVEIGLIEYLEFKELKERETFKGTHNMVEYKLRDGSIRKILLSQPIEGGEILCVDRWMDNHGNIYFPYIESDLDLKGYYSQMQNNKDLIELDYRSVALTSIRGSMGANYVKDSDLKFYEDVELQDFYNLPLNKYYGYIMEFKNYEWSDNIFMDFDMVEFLTIENSERLEELKVDINHGEYHIYNPTSYPNSFIIQENTKFYILDESGMSSKEVTVEDFIKYAEDHKKSLYEVIEIGFDFIEIREAYLP